MGKRGAEEVGLLAEKKQAKTWFQDFQKACCLRFGSLETSHWDQNSTPSTFTSKPTKTRGADGADRGGGVMSILKDGRLFEKVGVNVSTVYGVLEEGALQRLAAGKAIEGLEKDSRFWASGVSLVAHPRNPKVPAVHFNTRMFWTPEKWWFGGGSDLNPCLEFSEDTKEFHRILQRACDRTDRSYYPRFSKWADEYFFIRHRNRPRGVGGIFFDDLNTGDWQTDFQFVTDVGRAFFRAYLPLVLRRQGEEWTEADRQAQLVHRGLYTEFNLIYDRGTRFGLESGHDSKAVLMSLPPLASWP